MIPAARTKGFAEVSDVAQRDQLQRPGLRTDRGVASWDCCGACGGGDDRMRSVPGMPWMGWDGLGWMWGALFMVLSVD